MDAPKAFISHASEDKDQWGRPLAEELRRLGVDAWLDDWEMRPGDSLVNKIFNSGIRDAPAFVIILSHISIEKPWVKAELNVAVVNNIEGLTILIPVKVDDCQIPTALKDKLYLSIEKFGSTEKIAKEIADTLHNVPKAPPVGDAPAYIKQSFSLPGVNAKDAMVYGRVYNEILDESGELLQLEDYQDDYFIEQGLTQEDVDESISILTDHGYFFQRSDWLYTIHPGKALDYATTQGIDVDSIGCRIANSIINEECALDQLPDHLGIKMLHVASWVAIFKSRGFFQVAQPINSPLGFAHSVSPTFRRWARENCH